MKRAAQKQLSTAKDTQGVEVAQVVQLVDKLAGLRRFETDSPERGSVFSSNDTFTSAGFGPSK